MSQENVETIRRMYERWLQDDAALFDAFDREIELHPDPAADWVGVNDVYRGHDGVRRYMPRSTKPSRTTAPRWKTCSTRATRS